MIDQLKTVGIILKDYKTASHVILLVEQLSNRKGNYCYNIGTNLRSMARTEIYFLEKKAQML